MSATKSGIGTGFGFAIGAIIAVSLLLLVMCGGCALLGIGTTGVAIEGANRRAVEEMNQERKAEDAKAPEAKE